MALLPWLWVVGSPVTFATLSLGLVGTGRLRRRSEPLVEGPIVDSLARLRRALGIGQRVGVAVCDSLVSPVLVGIVRPMILLPPAALTGWSPEEVEMVLLHELAHVRRWDNLVNLLQRIVESLLFFHPCVWWVSSWVRRDREECCDAVVVRHTAQPQAYAELLVALAANGPQLSAAASLAMARHPLGGRIRRILKLEEEPMLVSRKMMGLIVCGALALVLAAPLLLSTGGIELQANEPASGYVDSTSEETIDEDYVAVEDALPQESEQYVAEETAADPVIARVYALDSSAVDQEVTEYLQTLQGLSEFRVATIEGKQSVVVAATQNAHEQLSELLEEKRGGAAKSLFPTLEEQMAADLAYKILGFELEKLTEEELARVKKFGYGGGLRVAFTLDDQAGGFGGGRGGSQHFGPGDLLVGLHVWPTETLTQVNEILQREDLSRLTPLKYYVIRSVTVREAEAEEQERQPESQESDPFGGFGGLGGMGGEFGGGFGGGMGGRGRRAPVKVVDKLVTGRFTPNMQAWSNEQQVLRLERQRKQSQQYWPTPENWSDAESSPQGNNERIPDTGQTKLLYGKRTFAMWKSQWRRDLSIGFRVEAVEAFVAFANAGVGKEAVDEILEIAQQYPWESIGVNELIQPVQEACVAVFQERQILPELAVETVVSQAKTKDPNLRAFFPYVLRRMAGWSAEANETLRAAFPDVKLRTFKQIEAERNQLFGTASPFDSSFSNATVVAAAQDSVAGTLRISTASEKQQVLKYHGNTLQQWLAQLQEKDRGNRLNAMDALARFARRDEENAVEIYHALLETLQTDLDQNIQLKSIEVLSKLPEASWRRETLGIVLEIGGQETHPYAEQLLNSFRYFTAEDVVPAVLAAAKHEDPQVRQFAELVAEDWTRTNSKLSGEFQQAFPEMEIPSPQAKKEITPSIQEEIIFAGRPFAQWKRNWRQDISPEFRQQAIDAFVTYANSGMADEAIEQILQIAGSYRWDDWGSSDSLISNLRETCAKVFTNQRIPLQTALAALIEARDSENEQIINFAKYVASSLADQSRQTNRLLREAFPDTQISSYEQQVVWATLEQGFGRDLEARLNHARQTFGPASEDWSTLRIPNSQNPEGPQEEKLLYRKGSYEEWKKKWRSNVDGNELASAAASIAAFAYRDLAEDAIDELISLAGRLPWDDMPAQSLGHNPQHATCILAFAILPLEKALEAVEKAKGSDNPFVPFAVVTLARRSAEANERLRKEFPEIEIPPYKAATGDAAG